MKNHNITIVYMHLLKEKRNAKYLFQIMKHLKASKSIRIYGDSLLSYSYLDLYVYCIIHLYISLAFHCSCNICLRSWEILWIVTITIKCSLNAWKLYISIFIVWNGMVQIIWNSYPNSANTYNANKRILRTQHMYIIFCDSNFFNCLYKHMTLIALGFICMMSMLEILIPASSLETECVDSIHLNSIGSVQNIYFKNMHPPCILFFMRWLFIFFLHRNEVLIDFFVCECVQSN